MTDIKENLWRKVRCILPDFLLCLTVVLYVNLYLDIKTNVTAFYVVERWWITGWSICIMTHCFIKMVVLIWFSSRPKMLLDV